MYLRFYLNKLSPSHVWPVFFNSYLYFDTWYFLLAKDARTRPKTLSVVPLPHCFVWHSFRNIINLYLILCFLAFLQFFSKVSFPSRSSFICFSQKTSMFHFHIELSVSQHSSRPWTTFRSPLTQESTCYWIICSCCFLLLFIYFLIQPTFLVL